MNAPALPPPPPSAPGAGYHLHELHLYNWGAFAGRHNAGIDEANTAIIGPTGSGKTTLIDALMTLLCQNPRYNLASTGGHESDRDLVSYVRGASGPGHTGDDSDHLARSGRTVTAAAARLTRSGAREDDVLIGAIFWFDGSSSSVSDLGRRWFFAQGPAHNLDLWLEEHREGGARALGRLEKSTEGLQIFTSKTAYLARLQRFFEVGPNAFTLLNRAAGLKQLNSIDEIFRELVLDDQSAFDDALEVAKSFDELATIHDELKLATQQYLALLPLRDMAQQEQQQQQRLAELRRLQVAVPYWFVQEGLLLWQQRGTELKAQLELLQERIDGAQSHLRKARAEEQARMEDYLRTGGTSIQLLQESIATQEQELGRRQSALSDYQKLVRNLALSLPADGGWHADLLADHQSRAHAALQALDSQQAERVEAAEAAVAHERNAHKALQDLKDELAAVRQRPGSNVPSEFQRFRSALAEQLDLDAGMLPYVAELIEVHKDQHAWRGAIERAIGSHRLRILVPAEAMDDALRWVNQRHNQLHVRLLEAQDARPTTFWTDGFCRKLTFKPHAHQNALRKLLAEQDRHCVDSVDALRTTPHAMTQQGLMSGKAQHFDKQDQKRLNEDWMTGFDNQDRLHHLAQQITQAEGEWQRLAEKKSSAQAVVAQANLQHQLWQDLLALRFEALDVATTQATLHGLREQLARLLDPQSDAAQAKAHWEAAKKAAENAAVALGAEEQQHTAAQTQLRAAEKKQAECANRLADMPAETPTLDASLALLLPGGLPSLDCEQLDHQERETLAAVYRLLETQQREIGSLHTDLVRQMGKALKEDRGALTDHPAELDALPYYLERLRVLEEEALPDKRQRFQDYLNSASEQGVSTLLKGIDTQVVDITERIAELNQTLARVDFQPGRYLQLDPQPVVHQSLQMLNKAMGHLRTERLRDDGGQSHYRALQEMVELLREHATNRRTKAAQALLDARYRLQFAVQVMDRDKNKVLERRTGSQGGSGGEKEIIASYVLTASLSYALCPPGRNRPLFRSIVLDEAFSKSSQAVAARIIQALREFGLHALFVTPNKELRLLRNHTRSAVVVHRRARQATLACLSWQELNEYARQRQDAAASA